MCVDKEKIKKMEETNKTNEKQKFNNMQNDNLKNDTHTDANNVLAAVNFTAGQKVRCIKNDPMDDRCGIADHLRWHIGDEFIVESVDVYPWGTFLNDGKGHNLNARRAEVVG